MPMLIFIFQKTSELAGYRFYYYVLKLGSYVCDVTTVYVYVKGNKPCPYLNLARVFFRPDNTKINLFSVSRDHCITVNRRI